MNKILILGASGFIGSHFVKKCLDNNFKVYAVSLKKDLKISHKNLFHKKVSLENLINDKIVKINFEYIVNLSGYIDHSISKNKSLKIINNHFLSVYNLINTMPKKKLIKFIQIGSSDEYGYSKSPLNEKLREDPFTPYSFSKVAITHYLMSLYHAINFPFLVIRLFLVYGPGQSENRLIPYVIKNSIKNNKFKLTDGNQKRDFLYIDDAIEAIYKLMINKKINGKIINLSSGKPITVKNIVLLINKIIGKGNPIFGKIINTKLENSSLWSKSNIALKKINWKPKFNIQKGLQETIDYFKK